MAKRLRPVRSVLPRGFLALLALQAILPGSDRLRAQSSSETDRSAERALVDSIQTELLPQVCTLAGFDRCERVPVEVLTRAELRLRVSGSMNQAFPNDEWSKLGRCLAEIGLNRRGVDLQDEFLDFLVSQAGAGYDADRGSYVSLLDVPPRMKSPGYRTLIVAHELTHAFQDQAVDFQAMHLADLSSLDRSFAHRGAFEGMASVVMYSLGQGVPLNGLTDVSALMRDWIGPSPETLGIDRSGDTPPVLAQYLFEPYVAGSAFVQDFLSREPETPLASLLSRLPVTGEQILHPEQYRSDDLPTPIDLSDVQGLLPEGWRELHRNELGEQDLRLLFALHGSTPRAAQAAASGWDGLSFIGFVSGNSAIALVGESAWDSPEDAEGFHAPFREILTTLHGDEGFGLRMSGNRVSFVVGFERELTEKILNHR